GRSPFCRRGGSEECCDVERFTIAVKAFTLDLTLSKHRSPGGASRSEFDREDRPRDDVIDRAIAAAHSRRRTGSRSRRPAPPPQAHVAPKQTPQGLADAGPDDPEGVIYNPHPADSEYIYEKEKELLELMMRRPTNGLYSDTSSKKGTEIDSRLSDVRSSVLQGRTTIDDFRAAVKAWEADGGNRILAASAGVLPAEVAVTPSTSLWARSGEHPRARPGRSRRPGRPLSAFGRGRGIFRGARRPPEAASHPRRREEMLRDQAEPRRPLLEIQQQHLVAPRAHQR